LNQEQLRFKHNTDDFIQLHQILNKTYANEPLVSIGIAPHSLRAVDVEQIGVLINALEEGIPTHIHIAEQIAEVEQSIVATGKTPVNLLFDQLPIAHNWCLIHATHLQTEEINKIVSSGASVGLCPTTEANLGDGLFPLMQFSEQLGSWGIGSDSQVCIDPKQELLLLEYGQRLHSKNRVIYSSESRPSTATNLILDAATGGKRALQSSAGKIEVGSRADLIALNIPPQFCHYDSQQIISKWMYSSRDNWVDSVMVRGRWVIAKGQHNNQQRVNAELAEVLQKLN